MPRIALVIGGAGFVGSHLLKSLQTSGEYDALVSADISEPRFAVEGGVTTDMGTNATLCQKMPTRVV